MLYVRKSLDARVLLLDEDLGDLVASTPLCFGNVEKVLWVRSCAHRICVWPRLDT